MPGSHRAEQYDFNASWSSVAQPNDSVARASVPSNVLAVRA
jgi:hypothetical protein